MVTTKDSVLGGTGGQLRNHGASVSEEARHLGPRPYLLPDFDLAGYNYRMTDLQGAVGIAQMDRLDALIAERRARAAWYQSELRDVERLTLPYVPDECAPHWQALGALIGSAAPARRNPILEG